MKTVRILLNQAEYTHALAEYCADKHGIPPGAECKATVLLTLGHAQQGEETICFVEQARVELEIEE